jgi:hypothetical protein
MKGAVPWCRPKVLVTCAVTIAAAGAALLVAVATGGTARANGSPEVTQSSYSVLSGAAAGDAAGSAPPSASTGEGNRPVGSSMTEIDIGNADLTVSVAKSTEGGVCIFVERHGARGAGGSCGTAALLKTGATAEVREPNGPTTIVGLVPDGVSAVKVGFADGTSQAVKVVNNGWAVENAPASMTSATDVVGG